MKCPECGTENQKGAAFCAKCGKELESHSVAKSIGLNTGKGLAIACCFGLLLLVAAGSMFSPDETTSYTNEKNTQEINEQVSSSNKVASNKTPPETKEGWDTCPRCGAPDGESLYSTQDGSKDYIRCRECGYEWWATVPEYLRVPY